MNIRDTIASKIRNSSSEQEKLDIAAWGRPLSEAERWMDEWIANTEMMQAGLSQTTPNYQGGQVGERQERARQMLWQCLTQAFLKRDDAMLIQLAKHLIELRNAKKSNGPADKLRLNLLAIKLIHPEGMELSSLAVALNYRGDRTALTRLANDVGFNLIAGKSGRPKKVS